jgi:hypothetical protein
LIGDNAKMAKINLRESLNKIDLATDNKYDLLNTFDSKKLSDENKKKLAEAIENNSMASINRVLHESSEQLYKVVISSGATKRNFESALYEDEAEGIVDYYGGRWIDENGFEWNMYVEEDDDSIEHAAIDNSYAAEDDERAQRECVESLNEASAIRVFPRGSEEYFKLDKVASWLTYFSPNNIYYTVEQTYFDYGQDWKWTTIIAYKSESDSWQAINPKQQESILACTTDEELEKVAKNILRESRLDKVFDESLTESSYGGAYDIEDDMFFTKEEIIEFADNICEYLEDVFGYQYNINNVYMDGPRKLYINIFDNNYIEVESTFDIDMRKIRKPSDLFKVYGLTIENWFQKAFAREYRDAGLDESLSEKNLKEDFDDEYESDFDNNEVEEGNHVFADGEEYVWVERIAGPIYLDFDKWAVWSARVFVDPRDFMTIHSDGKDYDFDGDAFKKKAMAAPIVYFVVEEDTGFIDWGPEDNEIAAKDFLNGKQEDWDNDEYYGESLEKNLDEWYVHTIHYEDIGNGREYDYEVDHEEVLDYLSEIAIDEEDAPEDTEEYLKWIEDNFDELFNKYEYEIEEHFREDASQEEYDRRHSSYES